VPESVGYFLKKPVKCEDEKEEGWVGHGSCKIMAGTGSSYLEKSKLLETSAFHNKMSNQQKRLKFLLLKENTLNHSTIYYRCCKHSRYSRVDKFFF